MFTADAHLVCEVVVGEAEAGHLFDDLSCEFVLDQCGGGGVLLGRRNWGRLCWVGDCELFGVAKVLSGPANCSCGDTLAAGHTGEPMTTSHVAARPTNAESDWCGRWPHLMW